MNLKKLKKLIDKHKIISFDIFDTLLLRPYVNPNDLFLHLEKLYSADGFKAKREQAFKLACNKYEIDGIEEVTYDQIYEFVPEEFQFIKEKELELEERILLANSEMQEIYNYAKERGKEIIIISDMYLPESFIKKILEKNGYTNYKKLFLSSTYKKLKYTKTLYKEVLNELQESANKILHIGDNLESDIKSAKACKFGTFYYKKIIKCLFEKDSRAESFYLQHTNDLTTSIMLGLSALNKNINYWYNLGFQHGGLLVYSYMMWLRSQLMKDGIKEILFTARDGYNLQKIFNIITNNEFSTHYIYAPRIMNLICTLDIKEKIKATDWEGLTAINAIIKYFDKHDGFNNISDAKAYFDENYDRLKFESKNELEKYTKYIKSFQLKDEKIAFVDVMTTFYTGQKLIVQSLKDKIIQGYYYYISPAFNVNAEHLIHKSCCDSIFDLPFLELLISSPEPPIQYVRDGLPVFDKKNSQQETNRELYYNDISDGIIGFSVLANNLFKDDLLSIIDFKIISEWNNHFKFNPTMEDITNFKDLGHAWEVNHLNYVPIFENWQEKEILHKESKSKKILQYIFSVKNNSEHKVWTLFGIKMKFRRKKGIMKKVLKAICSKTNEEKHIVVRILGFKIKFKRKDTAEYIFENLEEEFKKYIIETNSQESIKKLIPRTPEQLHIEVNLVDHCNLNCKFCDHFSPIAEEFYLDLETFEKDVKQLGKLTKGKMGEFSLLGGEPFLHKDICKFFEISRKYLPYGNIDVTSNGLLLLHMPEEIWDSMKKYNIKLLVTTYPIKVDYEKIDQKAKEKGILYERFYMFETDATEKVSVHHPLDLTGSVGKYDYINCYFLNKCSHLKNGMLSTCSIAQTYKIFNKYFNKNLQASPNDCINIHKVKSYKEIANFLVKRPDFCNYCDVNNRTAHEYGLSKKDISEWTLK